MFLVLSLSSSSDEKQAMVCAHSLSVCIAFLSGPVYSLSDKHEDDGHHPFYAEEREEEFYPFLVRNLCKSECCDEVSRYRIEDVRKSIAELACHDCDLAGKSDEVRKRSHDRHCSYSLAGTG